MKLLLISLIIVFVIIICLLVSMYIILERYQRTAEEIKSQYAEEAQQLDTMSGLLTGLFDMNNPYERKLCAHCRHIKACMHYERMPDSINACGYFDERAKE